MHKDNWESKLANPARVAVAPAGASDEQSLAWFRRVMAWGVNTVFSLRPGYDVKLLESNGRGFESFETTIAAQDHEFVMAVCGQTVTTDGGTGFANADVHRSIRADLIKSTADALAYTINTQVLPAWIAERFGEDAIFDGATVEWDVAPPKDKTAEASSLSAAAGAIKSLTEALAPTGLALDVSAVCTRFGVPVSRPASSAAAPVADVVPIRKAVPA